MAVVGSETCSFQFDFFSIFFLIYFCLQESWTHQPQSAVERRCLHTWATKKEEMVGQLGSNRSESWRTLGRRRLSEAKVSSHRAVPTCSRAVSQEDFSVRLSLAFSTFLNYGKVHTTYNVPSSLFHLFGPVLSIFILLNSLSAELSHLAKPRLHPHHQ